MARGGGTGSRNKKKKSAEATPATQNGSADNQKPGLESGGGDGKQNIKNTRHRKQKEDTPPVIPPEEDQKESQASKLVPTSEQLRLAQITQSADTNMDPQRKAKISQVMDITGKTEDEVATALFDCAWDETKAIELLLEEGGLGSWETTGQKKKKKADKDETGKENEDWNEEFDPTNQFSDNRERSRNRGPPRLRNRGGSSVQGGGREGEQWKSREFQENERNFEGGRGRGGRGMGPRSRGGGQGGMPPRQRGRGGGPRGFSNRGEFGERGERAERPVGESGGLGQIDTWNPIGQEQQDQRQQQRHHKLQNKDAFDNAGNWGDDFPTAEDWDNDEYTGSLSDTKVFTPSGSSAKAVGEPVNGSVSHPAVGSGSSHPASQPTPANNSLGSSYSQPIDLSTLLKPGGLAGGGASAAPGGPTQHSQYNQTATQDLKSAIGIGKVGGEQLAPGYGSSSSMSYTSGTVPGVPSPYTSTASHQPSSFNSPAPGSAFSPIKPAAVTNGSGGGSKALPRARLPPPSKIPSSAVEMPGDSLSNLDVQFGGMDLQFGGSNNDSNSSNFDFNAAPGPGVSSTPPGPVKDSLDSKYVHSIQSSGKQEAGPPLDSYKAPGQPSLAPGAVKDVNQSLSSALSAAGIKPSSSTDSVPGYGREGPSRPDSKSTVPGYGVPGSAPQRSPGPLITKADTLGGYNSPAYSYQSNNQSAAPGKGNNFTNYGPGQSYERQNSSGYSSTNGLSSSYGGGSGGGSSYNSGVPSNSSGYSANNGGYPGSQQGSSFNTGYGNAATTNYSPYTSNNSYSSKSGAPSSTSYIPTSTTASLSQYSNTQDNSTTSGSSKSSYDTATVSAGYGTVPTTGLGLSGSSMVGGGTVSSSSKMSVNTTSGKMVPGMPPGVASVLPAQYMIGANAAAAGFPAYLAAAGLGQAPAMYGYGGHQLEDLAALQRSTLAASLPQLVGSHGSPGQGAGQTNQPSNKGPSTGYYDPSSQFGGAGVPSTLASRGDQQSSFGGDNSKFGGGVTDSTSSPVPTSVANAGQPTPFNALASTFAAAAPQQHPTLPPGYAYFYGGVGGMPGALQAYGQGVGGGVYPATHPGIPVPTAAGATNTSQFQNKPYASSYGNSYDSLNLGQSNSGYGKNNYGSDNSQAKSGSSSSNAGLFQVTATGAVPSGKLMAGLGRDQRYW